MAHSANETREGPSQTEENKNSKTTHKSIDPSSLSSMLDQPTHHDYDEESDGSQLDIDNIRIRTMSNVEGKFGTFDELQALQEVNVTEEEMKACVKSPANVMDSKLSYLLQARRIWIDSKEYTCSIYCSEYVNFHNVCFFKNRIGTRTKTASYFVIKSDF